jgi:hypothetical protein
VFLLAESKALTTGQKEKETPPLITAIISMFTFYAFSIIFLNY